jgi:hypothetical protein
MKTCLRAELPCGSVEAMSRMTTGMKLGVCVGLLAVAAGVVLVRSHDEAPAVTVSFLRYTDDGAAILNFRNRGRSPVGLQWRARGVMFSPKLTPENSSHWSLSAPCVLMPRQETQLVARSVILLRHYSPTALSPLPALPATVSMHCMPQHSPLRCRIEVLLRKVGINIASTGFVAAVDLPAR